MNRSYSGHDQDFSPYDDEYRGFDISDDDSGRGPLILLLALGVLLIFAGVVWNTYRQGVRPVAGGLPVIGETNTDFKRQPAERGGVEVAGQDVGFYDLMDGGDAAGVQKASVANPVALRRESPTLAGAPEKPVPSEDTQEELIVPSKAAPIEFAEGLDTREPAKAGTEPYKTASLKPTPLGSPPQSSTISELPDPVRNVPSRFASAGEFQVQLLASRSESGARDAWAAIKKNEPDLFKGADLHIQMADLGARGIFYRLRLGAFETRDAAKAFCVDVKKTGKDCIVVAKATA